MRLCRRYHEGERSTKGRMRGISWLWASHLICSHLLKTEYFKACVFLLTRDWNINAPDHPSAHFCSGSWKAGTDSGAKWERFHTQLPMKARYPACSQPHWGSWNHHPIPRSWHWTRTEEGPVWTHGPLRWQGETGGQEAPHCACFMHSKALHSALPSIPCLPWPPAARSLQVNTRCMALCPQMEIDIGCLGGSLVMLNTGYNNNNNYSTRISGGISNRCPWALLTLNVLSLVTSGRNAICLVPRKLPWKQQVTLTYRPSGWQTKQLWQTQVWIAQSHSCGNF